MTAFLFGFSTEASREEVSWLKTGRESEEARLVWTLPEDFIPGRVCIANHAATRRIMIRTATTGSSCLPGAPSEARIRRSCSFTLLLLRWGLEDGGDKDGSGAFLPTLRTAKDRLSI